jgi:hypothetical protein
MRDVELVNHSLGVVFRLALSMFRFEPQRMSTPSNSRKTYFSWFHVISSGVQISELTSLEKSKLVLPAFR